MVNVGPGLRPAGKDGDARIHMEDPAGPAAIAAAVRSVGTDLIRGTDALILLCVGTDRSIGDALGPLVGSLLEEQRPWPFRVLGTLDRPVHAGNLAETATALQREHRHPLVVAVDACLGRAESIGYVTVARGPLKPGAGVNKNLPAVGQVHITGVVNVGGFMEYFVLQNTRLNLVMRMAKTVAQGLGEGLSALSGLAVTQRIPPG